MAQCNPAASAVQAWVSHKGYNPLYLGDGTEVRQHKQVLLRNRDFFHIRVAEQSSYTVLYIKEGDTCDIEVCAVLLGKGCVSMYITPLYGSQ